MNRGAMGSGHGWTMGWGVAWNNDAKTYVIQMPPGSANWGIGSRREQLVGRMKAYDPGPELPQGIIKSQEPQSRLQICTLSSCANASEHRHYAVSATDSFLAYLEDLATYRRYPCYRSIAACDPL